MKAKTLSLKNSHEGVSVSVTMLISYSAAKSNSILSISPTFTRNLILFIKIAEWNKVYVFISQTTKFVCACRLRSLVIWFRKLSDFRWTAVLSWWKNCLAKVHNFHCLDNRRQKSEFSHDNYPIQEICGRLEGWSHFTALKALIIWCSLPKCLDRIVHSECEGIIRMVAQVTPRLDQRW